MKIAFVSQPWECMAVPHLGSVEIVTYGIASRLARRGHNVVVCARQSRNTSKQEDRDGLRIVRFPVLHEDRLLSPLEGLLFRQSLPLVASWMYAPAYIHQVARYLSGQRFDIIHVQNFSQFVPVLRRYNPSAKIVLHMHCHWLCQFDREEIARRLDQTDAIAGCGSHVTEKVRARFGELSARCFTVHNGIDVDEFVGHAGTAEDGQSRNQRLLFVGRLSPEKGVHFIVESFLRIADRFPDAELNIVGPDWVATKLLKFDLSDDALTRDLAGFTEPYGDFVRRLAQTQGNQRITFTGFVPCDGMPALYARHSLLVCASLCHEAFPLPVIEAMASALPVVGTRSGGVVEQVDDGRTGVLVERGDVPALSNAMASLLGNPERIARMGEAARERAIDLFSWSAIIPQWEHLYEKLCHGAAANQCAG
ncbi:MAG TPA: glycosyltransferase family 4 protein [Bryobacteraceae bacterium]|nr:glycosyltransferase family 4 protein [Bryobacteraceae bacterium]